MRPGDTPVPIPNTMVKTWPADGTALETVWESRWPPDYKRIKRLCLIEENIGDPLRCVRRLERFAAVKAFQYRYRHRASKLCG